MNEAKRRIVRFKERFEAAVGEGRIAVDEGCIGGEDTAAIEGKLRAVIEGKPLLGERCLELGEDTDVCTARLLDAKGNVAQSAETVIRAKFAESNAARAAESPGPRPQLEQISPHASRRTPQTPQVEPGSDTAGRRPLRTTRQASRAAAVREHTAASGSPSALTSVHDGLSKRRRRDAGAAASGSSTAECETCEKADAAEQCRNHSEPTGTSGGEAGQDDELLDALQADLEACKPATASSAYTDNGDDAAPAKNMTRAVAPAGKRERNMAD